MIKVVSILIIHVSFPPIPQDTKSSQNRETIPPSRHKTWQALGNASDKVCRGVISFLSWVGEHRNFPQIRIINVNVNVLPNAP